MKTIIVLKMFLGKGNTRFALMGEVTHQEPLTKGEKLPKGSTIRVIGIKEIAIAGTEVLSIENDILHTLN